MTKPGKRAQKKLSFLKELTRQVQNVIRLQYEMEASEDSAFQGRSHELRFDIVYEQVSNTKYEELRAAVLNFQKFATEGWTFTLVFPLNDPAKFCLHYHCMRMELPFGLHNYKHVELSPSLLNAMTVDSRLKESLMQRLSLDEDKCGAPSPGKLIGDLLEWSGEKWMRVTKADLISKSDVHKLNCGFTEPKKEAEPSWYECATGATVSDKSKAESLH